MKKSLGIGLFLGAAVASSHAAGFRFVVVDPLTGRAIDGLVTVEESSGFHRQLLATPLLAETLSMGEGVEVSTIAVPAGSTVTLRQQQGVPTKEITIRVTARRLVAPRSAGATSGTTRTREDLQKFVNTTQPDTRQLTKGQPGIAEDSAGQQHVRGEHSEVAFVVDGVPLPDTLSGREGSVVVPRTIQNLEIITGGFAPEFGGQTAAVLNISTLPNVEKARADLTMQYGTYRTELGDLTAEGPIGKRANYVVDVSATRTDNQIEPPQPDNQTAHNHGSSRNLFTKFRLAPSSRDAVSLTLSQNPDASQIANRTGLGPTFSAVGEGYGFGGLRNANGVRPDATEETLGSQTLILPSQEAAGQDIRQNEVSEFATLNLVHQFGKGTVGQIAATVLHSGQDVYNFNPAVDLSNLPVDNSIEFNPTAARNVHHLQWVGSLESRRGSHRLKLGGLLDEENGDESYRIVPSSQLALDALAALDPALAPPGSASSAIDVNGNPVFTATGATPTLRVHRTGSYSAAYVQDTYESGRFTANYGLRYDRFTQKQSLGGGAEVKADEISPRLNLQYRLDKRTRLGASYDRLFNTPPVAQGAIVGAAIQPEILSQYDLALNHDFGKGHTLSLAYYYKDIRNQVDTGLLIPGSQIGLYSGVNFQKGGVHGVELGYDVSSNGWDGYLNYSYSTAKPNGKDNTGADVPDLNDHDQRHTLGIGVARSWRSGGTASLTYQFGSGLASSVIPPKTGPTPRDQFDLRLTTGDRLFRGKGGLELDVQNVFDRREVINFNSAFSGTRFMQGRRITLGANFRF